MVFQSLIPGYPDGATHLNKYVCMLTRDDRVVYFVGSDNYYELFSAYDYETLQHYTSMLSTDVTTAMVQNALESLITREIIWMHKRGGYFIDDPLWNDWMEYNSRANDAAGKKFVT